jgi:hypothetical protein
VELKKRCGTIKRAASDESPPASNNLPWIVMENPRFPWISWLRRSTYRSALKTVRKNSVMARFINWTLGSYQLT